MGYYDSVVGAKARPNPFAGGSGRSLLSGNAGFAVSGPSANKDVGKASIDLTDPAASALQAIGSIGEFAGGVLGGIGDLGVGDFKIKDAVEGVTESPIVQGIGSGIGAIGGGVMDVLSAPGRFIEEQAARKRLGADDPLANIVTGAGNLAETAFGTLMGDIYAGQRAFFGPDEKLPGDIQARLDAGEDIDQLAKDMVESGRGYSSNVTKELGLGLALDPLNVIGPGIGKVGTLAKAAGRAVEAGEQVGRVGAITGRTYNALAGGLTASRQGLVRAALGPITSGVVQHFGIANYTGLKGSLGRLSPAYATSFDDALAMGNAQLARAEIGNRIGAFWRLAVQRVAKAGEDIRGALPGRADLERDVETGLAAAQKLDKGRFERSLEHMIAKVAPDFLALSDAERAAATAQRLAQITGMSVKDATAALGKVDLGKAQMVHLAFYGKAADDLVAAKGLVGASKTIDVDRLTLLAPSTLDVDTAIALREAIAEGDDIADAIKQYDILSERFLGKDVAVSKVDSFIGKMLDNDALPQAVREPVTGANPLPRPLREWRETYGETYKMGFSPKSGWKAIIGEDGEIIVGDPFVHLQSARQAVTTRNPIGQFADSLFRGVTQQQIIADATYNMARKAQDVKAGISPSQTKAIIRAIFTEAYHEQVAPRGLTALAASDGRGGNRIDAIFRRFLSDEEYATLTSKIEPTVLLMEGMRGNWTRVGLTQALTGRAKIVGAKIGLPIAQIAEYHYPNLRFRYNAFFQTQEYMESPFWNRLRGIKDAVVAPEVQEALDAVQALPEYRTLTEAGATVNLVGQAATRSFVGENTKIGRAMARYTRLPVKQSKEAARAAQVFGEHGEAFETAVNRLNPRLWSVLKEAYGTDDANQIAQRFFTERLQIATGQIEDALSGAGIQKAMDAGEIAKSQQLNRAVAAQRGGTAASGGAIKGGLRAADVETVMEAWRYSFQETARQAFTTHFFNPERGWLERTLNHPYLGLYPLSYMWGKVIPEFARFLLKRPFGVNAPLVGYAAMVRTQGAMLAAVQDPEFAEFVKNHQDSIYAIELLLPGTPTNLPVNAPAWARHLVQDKEAGRKITAETVSREVTDSAGNVFSRPFQPLTLGAGVIGDLTGDLERAAKQYDTWVGNRP